jgi:uncharacterized iron-regulated membrane protein
MSSRRLWLVLHRWLALTLGVVLGLVALMGATLTVAKPLDRWANSHLFESPSGDPRDAALLARARSALLAEFGTGAGITFRPPRAAGDSLWAMVRGPWHGTVYFDPATVRELGRRGETEGLYNLLFELHSSLLMDDVGKGLLALLASSYVVMLTTGLVLWWPARWSAAWRVETRRGARRAVYDTHRVAGSLLGVLVAVSVATGAYMAWRPLSSVVNVLAGAQGLRPPTVTATGAVAPAGLDELVLGAQALFPAAMVGYVQVPADPRQAVRIRLKLPDDPHPNGLTSLWLHPRNGSVLRVDRWSALDPGARAYSVIYPLHIGQLGGSAHTALNALLGLVLFGFAGTGTWLWWQRRPLRRHASRPQPPEHRRERECRALNDPPVP